MNKKEEKKKMGRPTTNPRNKQITLRLSDDELNTLNECSEKLSINRVEVVVKGIQLVKEEIG